MKECKYELFKFPAGETGVKIKEVGDTLTLRFKDNNDIFNLALIKNAIENIHPRIDIDLIIPYFPYARQDRVCNYGESLSAKVAADFINYLDFKTVTVFDPHSNVTSALLNNVRIISRASILCGWVDFRERIRSRHVIFVSPDSGAYSQTNHISAILNKELICASKVRDLQTGNITHIQVSCDRLEGKTCFMLDDICDGGATFISLAKQLKEKGADKVLLYVTHGVFSKGEDILFENGIDEVWTTDSYESTKTKSKVYKL